MINPAMGENLIAAEIRRTYAEAELRVLESMSRELTKGRTLDVVRWEREKLANLRELTGGINRDVIDYLENSNHKVADAVEEAYKMGLESAEVDLDKVGQLQIKGTFTQTHQRAVEALANEVVGKLDATHLRILRSTQDIYRRAVAEAVRGVVAGAEPRIDAAQRVLNTFANQGVTGFIDNAGRSWNLASYSEMATRSATGRAAINGHIQRMQDNDRDLVMVSQHGEECELCRPWEGRVLSISGEHDSYPSLAEAEAEGLFHPNCAHNLSAYIHNLTVTDDATPTPDEYEDRQQQRYNERQIRKWKRREAAALTDGESDKARAKVSEWQSKQREFLDETGRMRKYEREQINEAR